jgi:tetratricopeptide (TPR) repeat protein
MKRPGSKNFLDLPEELGKAIKLHQNGMFQQAKNIYKKIIRHSPRHPEALHMLGIIYSQTGKFDTAIDLMRKSIKSAPGRPDYLFNLVQAFHGRADLDEALAACREYLRLVPDDADALHRMGRILHDKKEFAQAVINYRLALAKFPERVDYLNSLGLAYNDQGDLGQAVTCYEQALACQPDDFIVLNNLGDTLRRMQEFDRAMSCFRQALSVRPDYPEAHNNLGVILQKLGRMEEAAASFEKAVAVKPEYPEALDNLGIILKELGRVEKAVASFEKALAIRPDYADALNNLSAIFGEKGRSAEALTCLERALRVNPECPKALVNKGLVLQELGKDEAAVACFEKALSFKPDFPKAQIFLAINAWIYGEWEACRHSLDLISATAEILTREDIKFVPPYFIFLDKLLKYREANVSRYVTEGNPPIIYLVGDSHCLSTANTMVNFKGVDFLAEAKIVVGCKAWHLANKDNNRFKHWFEKRIESIPHGATAILMFGEIDCRPDEGIIKHYKKNNVNLTESITCLVNDYFKYILRVTDSRGISPIICSVPAPIEQGSFADGDQKLQKAVLAKFNQALADIVAKNQIPLLDVYTFLQSRKEGSDNEYYVDSNHLRPTVLGHLLKGI